MADVTVFPVAALLLAAPPPSAPVATGLVGYWPFNQGQGQTVLDMSGYGNNGYLGQNQSSADSADPIWTSTGPLCQTKRTYYVSTTGNDGNNGQSQQREPRPRSESAVSSSAIAGRKRARCRPP